MDDEYWMATAYNNLANCYLGLKEFQKSLDVRKKAILIREKQNNPTALADSYNDVGEAYTGLNNIDSAIYYFEKCLKIKEAVNDEEMIALSALNMGIALMKKKDFATAKKYLEKSMHYSERINSNTYRLHVLKRMAEIAGEEQHHDEEAELLKKIITLKDTIYNEQNRKEINLLQAEFDTERKELQITSLQKQREYEKLRGNLILVFSVTGIVVLAAFLLVLGNRFRIIKKQKTIIEEQKLIVDEKNKDVTDSINYAKKIQEAIFQPKRSNTSFFPDAFVLLLPRDIVSGDFYWFTKKNGKKIIAAVDCTGHGVPGAFMSMIGNTYLNELIEERGITAPAEILGELRTMVIRSLKQKDADDSAKDGMDMSLLSFAEDNTSVEFAGANNPLWLIRDKEVKEYNGDKRPIGYFRGQGLPFTNHRLSLQKSDCLYIFSDGYADQFGGEKGKKFKYKQLKELLVNIHQKPMPEQESILEDVFRKWKGALEQVDDVLVIGIRV